MHKNEEKSANYLKVSINCCTFTENFKIIITTNKILQL